MAAHLTALDVLNLVLVVGFLSALFGWAGGQGALRSHRARLMGIEDQLEAFDARIKRREGAAGQAATQRRRTALQQRDEEAERLAQALAQRGGRALRPLTEQDEEEAALAQLEREAEARGLKQKAQS